MKYSLVCSITDQVLNTLILENVEEYVLPEKTYLAEVDETILQDAVVQESLLKANLRSALEIQYHTTMNQEIPIGDDSFTPNTYNLIYAHLLVLNNTAHPVYLPGKNSLLSLDRQELVRLLCLVSDRQQTALKLKYKILEGIESGEIFSEEQVISAFRAI